MKRSIYRCRSLRFGALLGWARISTAFGFMGPGLLVALKAAPASSGAHPAGVPNIVLLVADDLGYGELDCQGNPEIPTPHIDSLARDGVRFTNGYVTAAYCSASRAGLLTGRYQSRFGYETNPIGAKNEDPEEGLPPSETTLGQLLQDRGYATALIGKWHLGATAKYHPLRRGFDEFFGFLHEGHYFVPPPYQGVTTMLRRRALPPTTEAGGDRWVSRDGKLVLTTHMRHREPDYDADNPIYRGGQPVEETEYLTDAFTREAVDFIGRHRERPFFLYLPYNAVHSPLQGADAWMKKFAHIEDIHRRIFAAMLANLDDSVGQVLAKLKEEGLEENTLVFFLSDNGGPTRELTSSNRPLRAGKGSAYEGGLRVPFLVRWKGSIPGGKTYEEPVISLDIFATVAAVTGAKPDLRVKRDGVNLMPFLQGKSGGAPHEHLFWRTGKRAALRKGDWKLVRNPDWGSRDADWELYNLAVDIGESRDLAKENTAKASELLSLWERMSAEMEQALPSPTRGR